jgi:uncharacterized membrane protein
MIVIIGLIALIAAAAVVVAGVVTNSGSSHALGDNFGIFGQHLNNASTGMLFLYGAVAGIIGMLGLTLLWGAFTRRLASGGMRRELKSTKREAEILRQDRDRLNKELEIERSKHLNASAPSGTDTTSVAD